MITLLAPLALFAASLLAIPIILHLFKPRKVRRTPFSSLRWLHLSQQKLARRIKWHQVILFLLRFAFIALLVLAIAKPVLSRSGDKAGFVERFIVLDVSRSMGYQATGRPTPIELGKEVAADIVRQGLAGDRTAVMLTGSTTRSLGPLSRDPAISLAALKDVNVTASDTDLGSALQVIRPMLARKRTDATIELHFITDNHQRSWREGEIASFVKDLGNMPVQVRIIDVGIPAAQNAWIADARVVAQSKRDAPKIIRAQVGCVGDAGQSRTIRVGGVQGLPEITKSVQLDPGNLVPVEIELPAALETRGQVAKLSIDPGDALPEDDEFFLPLDKAGGTKVLLVESDSSRIESLRPGFYIRAALAALAASDGRAIDVVAKTSVDLTDADLADADVVILADVPSLTDGTLTALESRVKSGAGLAIFLGPGIEPTFYNTKLHNPATPSESLLPMPLGAVASAPPQRLDTLSGIDWSHPLLAPLHDPVLGDFSQTLIRSYYRIEGTPAAEVLAAIDEHTPAILARSVGSGRVVVFNTTANDAWSDLPRRKSFVPLMDRLLAHLVGATGTSSGSFAVGETVTLPLSDVKSDAALTVTGPDGKKLSPVVQSQAGRTVIRLDSVQQPGIYRIESADPAAQPHTFVVQAGRGDSVLTPIDPAALRKWWEPTNVDLLTADAIAKSVAINSDRVALWPWLVGLACVVFVAEMFLVHWLCPRMNPGIVAPVIPRRGMFSVESERQEVGVN